MCSIRPAFFLYGAKILRHREGGGIRAFFGGKPICVHFISLAGLESLNILQNICHIIKNHLYLRREINAIINYQ